MNLIQKWLRRKFRGIDYDGWELCEFVEPVPIYSHPSNLTEKPWQIIVHIEIAYVNNDIVQGRWYKVRQPDGWIHEADFHYERRRYRERNGT